MDVSIYGYTDNQGWKNSTAAQSQQKNLNFTKTCTERIQLPAELRVSPNQIKGVQGSGAKATLLQAMNTAAGRDKPSVVEVYMYLATND